MGRECGECSLCCKLLGVTELNKPGGQWCEHAVLPGKGCGIYEDRPQSCRGFSCMWLRGDLPEYWRPLKSRMVVGFGLEKGEVVLQVYVDQGNRRGWEREPYFADIKKLAAQHRTEIRLFGPGAIVHVEVGNGKEA